MGEAGTVIGKDLCCTAREVEREASDAESDVRAPRTRILSRKGKARHPYSVCSGAYC